MKMKALFSTYVTWCTRDEGGFRFPKESILEAENGKTKEEAIAHAIIDFVSTTLRVSATSVISGGIRVGYAETIV